MINPSTTNSVLGSNHHDDFVRGFDSNDIPFQYQNTLYRAKTETDAPELEIDSQGID
jgi:hypothetical protein